MMSKRILTYLAALSILFLQGVTTIAKAESNQGTILKTTNEDYELMPINTIFNISENDLSKKVWFGSPLLDINLNGDTFVVPIILDTSGSTPEFGITRYLDVVSGDLIYTETYDHVFKITNDTVNNVYFKNMFRDSLSNSPIIIPLNLEQVLIKYRNQTLKNNEFRLNENNYRRYGTLEEYFELYKKIIPKEYWPVIFKLPEIETNQNKNPTLPKLKDDIMNGDLNNIGLGEVKKDKYLKFIIIVKQRVNDQNEFRDFFTNEIVSINGYLDDRYSKRIDVKRPDLLRFFYNYIMGGQAAETIKYFPEIKNIAPYFENLTTIKELIDAYQTLPLEFQVDYSGFDFSDNSNVDPAWLASQPVAAPSPFLELKVGSAGQEVLDLKQRFYELGYFKTTSFNNRFTENTASAVRQFEENNNLPIDGIADSQMLSVLYSDRAVGK